MGRGRHVAPRPGQQALGAGQALEGPEGVVAVAVGPAGDDHGRRLDPVVAGVGIGGPGAVPQRALAPVGRVDLLGQPAQHPGLGLVESPPPLLPPALPVDGGHRGQGVGGDHGGRVVDEIEGPELAADVVDVIGEAVVGGVDRADGVQRRRAPGRQLERVGARVGHVVHADRPGRPRLVGQPGEDLGEVGMLLGWVLVVGDALRGPRAPHIDPGHGEAALVGQPLVLAPLGDREIVLAVRQGLEDHRPRAVAGGQDQGGRQPDAVGRRDPGLLGPALDVSVHAGRYLAPPG